MQLNRRALQLVDALESRSIECRVEILRSSQGSRLIDAGARAPGSLQAGLMLSRICMADLAEISLGYGQWGPEIQVWSDYPAAACLASQYAGWRLHSDHFFGMGSGPMRAAAGGEELFDRIGFREQAKAVVGVIETRQKPTDEIIERIAQACQVEAGAVTLLFAPTASLAGAMQIVARSMETALHKMLVLGFDCKQIVAGQGIAPLPPVGSNDLLMIGRTNDAILYGSHVTLWVQSDDEFIQELGPRIPSQASPDHGVPFAELFARVHHDFYKIDPLLFSPAIITMVNMTSGRAHTFGKFETDIMQASFFTL